MTALQVEALLGGPRGVHDPALYSIKPTSACLIPSGLAAFWHFPGHRVIITFDAVGRVSDKRVGPLEVQGRAAWAWRWCAERLGLR
jgi:hypothetical protein